MDSNYVFDKDNVSFKKEKPSVMKILRKISYGLPEKSPQCEFLTMRTES